MSTIIAQEELEAPFPLSHARIGYDNLLTAASATEAEPALIPNTFERWLDASGLMESRFQPGSSVEIDFIGIASHNLGSTLSTIEVATSPTVNGTFTVVGAKKLAIGDDRPLMFLFDAVTVQDIKVTINGGTDREVGNVYAGKALVMPRPIYGEHNPIELRAETEFQQNISESGQFLGRNIIRLGLESNYDWKHLTSDFIRDEFMTFVESARTFPFFLKWRPDDFPDDAVFGHTENDIKPENMGGGHRLMTVSFNVRGHHDI